MIGAIERKRALRSLELEVLRRLDGILLGDYEGLIPGHGTELGEARPYEPGDDVRRIDWNVTARTSEPHVRDTIADRELELLVVVDLSGSMTFGSARFEKRDLAVAASAAFGFLVQRGGNRIGAVILEGDRAVRVPPRSGRRHLQGLLSKMMTSDREPGAADLRSGLREAAGVAKRRGLVVVVSDFLDEGAWHEPLAVLARRHDVIAVEVIDPRELELPDVGTLTIVDAETGRRRWVETRSRGVRSRFAEMAADRRSSNTARIRRTGADHLVIRTDRDWVADLVRHVARRRRGRTTGRRP